MPGDGEEKQGGALTAEARADYRQALTRARDFEMGRFFNREAALVAVSLLVAGAGVGALAGLRPWLIAAMTLAIVLLLHWPLTVGFQDWALSYYAEHDRLERALALAIEVRDSAVVRSERDKAHLNVALVHLARGGYEPALQNLRKIVTAKGKPAFKVVVEASTAYCLSHLGRELPTADALLEGVLKGEGPKDPLFGYFLGLLRFKQGRLPEARELIEKSLAEEADHKLPYPGERPYVLAQVLKQLGDAAGARAQLAKAKEQAGRFGELAAKDLAAA